MNNQNNNSFLPSSYEKPASQSKYYKFDDGDNKFRILSPAITGWLDWNDKNPVRTKDKPETFFNLQKPAKHFWAFVIWDYRDKNIKIMEITQSTIQDAIFTLHKDINWGNPMNYDINVNKKGQKMETKYNVMPIPPQPLNSEIKEIYEATEIDLNKLYSNEDPFIVNNDQIITDSVLDNIPFNFKK